MTLIPAHSSRLVYAKEIALWRANGCLANTDSCSPGEIPRDSEPTTIGIRKPPNQGDENKEPAHSEQSALPPSSPCPSLYKSVGSSAASTSAPPTPIPSHLLGETKSFIEGLECVPLLGTGGHIHKFYGAISDIQQVSQKPVPSVLHPQSPLCCKAREVKASREARPASKFLRMDETEYAEPTLMSSERCIVVGKYVDVPKRTDENEGTSLVVASTSGSQGNASAALEKDVSHARPRLRALLLPQEVERRALREVSCYSAPAGGIRPFKLPLQVAKRSSLLAGPQERRNEASRLSLSATKSLASDPPPRTRPFSEVPDLRRGPGASVDAIEIAKKKDRRSRNLEDHILLDEFGVTGAPQREDPGQSATVAAGTQSEEGVRGRQEVPGREVLDDSQGKQDSTCDGGVSAAFDGAGDVLRHLQLATSRSS